MTARIVDISCVRTESAYFRDDQAAIRAGRSRDGFRYHGTPITPGFDQIREPGRSLTVLLRLDDGATVTGDCVQVQYSGVAGRAVPLSIEDGERMVRDIVAPLLLDCTADSFRTVSALLRSAELPSWLEYGISQALLRAVAAGRRRAIADIVIGEWDLPIPRHTVPVLTQSGEAPRDCADRMIMKRVDALPHGLINNVENRLGPQGEKLRDLAGWLCRRIGELVPDGSYRPVLHFDVYGTLGLAFGSVQRIADYLESLETTVFPYRLRIEHPLDAGSRADQIRRLGALRSALRDHGSHVELVADEWCNTLDDIEEFARAGCVHMVHVKTPDLGGLDQTIEALLTCRRYGIAAYCGGTCNETVGSAQVSAQVALACGADLVLAKPGMGIDEGLSVVRNEMRVALHALHAPSTEAYR